MQPLREVKESIFVMQSQFYLQHESIQHPYFPRRSTWQNIDIVVFVEMINCHGKCAWDYGTYFKLFEGEVVQTSWASPVSFKEKSISSDHERRQCLVFDDRRRRHAAALSTLLKEVVTSDSDPSVARYSATWTTSRKCFQARVSTATNIPLAQWVWDIYIYINTCIPSRFVKQSCKPLLSRI